MADIKATVGGVERNFTANRVRFQSAQNEGEYVTFYSEDEILHYTAGLGISISQADEISVDTAYPEISLQVGGVLSGKVKEFVKNGLPIFATGVTGFNCSYLYLKSVGVVPDYTGTGASVYYYRGEEDRKLVYVRISVESYDDSAEITSIVYDTMGSGGTSYSAGDGIEIDTELDTISLQMPPALAETPVASMPISDTDVVQAILHQRPYVYEGEEYYHAETDTVDMYAYYVTINGLNAGKAMVWGIVQGSVLFVSSQTLLNNITYEEV